MAEKFAPAQHKMDHLPAILDPVYPWPKVLCLCRIEDYNFKGAVDFPERVR